MASVVSLLRVSCDLPLIAKRELAERRSLPSHVETISSPDNPFVKHCIRLRKSSSYRHSSASAIVVGITPIREILSFHEDINILDCLLLLDGCSGIPRELLNSFARVVNVNPTVMKKLSGLQTVDSIEAAAILKIPDSFYHIDNSAPETGFELLFSTLDRLLVLDGIQDPGNLGTLLRTAVAFDWDGVFLLPGCCDPFNEKAIRASRGSCFQIPIVSGRWVHLESMRRKFEMKMLAGHPNNSGNGKSPRRLSNELALYLKDKPLALVLGSEGQGLSEESENVCDLISISMAGGYESLNVSVAGGCGLETICLRNFSDVAEGDVHVEGGYCLPHFKDRTSERCLIIMAFINEFQRISFALDFFLCQSQVQTVLIYVLDEAQGQTMSGNISTIVY